MRAARATRAALAVAVVAVALGACGGAKKVVDGGECAQATDCEDGLVCVPQKGGARRCSRDLEGLGEAPDVPDRDAGAGEAGAIEAGARDARVREAAAPTDAPSGAPNDGPSSGD